MGSTARSPGQGKAGFHERRGPERVNDEGEYELTLIHWMLLTLASSSSPQIMLEEAQLSKGLTKEQNQHRIKMEKLGWEQEDRAEPKMCRWFDCEKPQGTPLQVCACRQPNIAYCSSECQK